MLKLNNNQKNNNSFSVKEKYKTYIYRGALGIILSPFILFLLLAIVIYLPPVQKWAVGIASTYAEEATGLKVDIGTVSLRFPLDLNLSEVNVSESGKKAGMKVSVGDVLCNVRLLPLFSQEVKVDVFLLKNAEVATASFIPDCRIEGTLQKFLLEKSKVSLKENTVVLDKIALNTCDLDICLSDTAQKDTTKTETPWRIILKDINAENARVRVKMPGDSMRVTAHCNLQVKDADIDLREERYRVSDISLSRSMVHYLAYPETEHPYSQVKQKGINYNNLYFKDINCSLNSLFYHGENLGVRIFSANAKEQSGLKISDLKAFISLNGNDFQIDDLLLKTPSSLITASGTTNLHDLAEGKTGNIRLKADAEVGKEDVLILGGEMISKDIRKLLAQKAFTLKFRMSGDNNCCKIDTCRFSLPQLLSGSVSGEVCSMLDFENLRAKATMNILPALGGSITGNANFSAKSESYDLTAVIKSINISKYMPDLGIGKCGGRLTVKGRGYDVLSKSTKIQAELLTNELRYMTYDLAGTYATMTLADGRVKAVLNSQTPILDGVVGVDALLSKTLISSTLSAEVKNVDFQALRMVNKPLSTGICGHIDVETDMKKKASIVAHLSDIRIQDSVNIYHPDDIEVNAFTEKDTTHAVVNCGDFFLRLNSRQGLTKLTNLISVLSEEMSRQLHRQEIDASAYRSKLPEATFFMRSGKENPFARLLSRFGFEFNALYSDFSMSPNTGINGRMSLDTLCLENMQIDKIALDIVSDADSLEYSVNVANGKKNKIPFEASLEGKILRNSMSSQLALLDRHDKKAIDIAMQAAMKPEGIVIGFDEREQILGYKPFKPNAGNYVRIGENMRLFANLALQGADNTGFEIYTNDENVDALQDVTLSLHNLDLEGIISVVPYMPSVSGIFSGDFHVEMTKENTTISSSISTKDLCYEHSMIGNLSTEVVYMPQADGTHYLDGVLYKDEAEVATIKGNYRFGVQDHIDADVKFDDFPVDIVNGFIPDKILGFLGTASGKLNVKGLVDSPNINGSLNFGNAQVISLPYGVKMNIDKRSLEIVNSNIVLEKYSLYDSKKEPVKISGYIDFSDFDHILTNMNIIGQNIMIIDAKETKHSEAYGKAYVNFYSMIQGELESLNVRARLEVLPSTNLCYILKDSPITTDNRMKELVTFVDFNDKKVKSAPLPTVNGMLLNLNIVVREGAHVVCWLNTNHTNYVDIVGSGEMRFIYKDSEMSLNGRYSISHGEMKYSLPIIPLKTFTISENSYVDFNGNIFNPRLNITATEQIKSTVSQDGVNKSVLFNCGVVLTKTLQDMGLQFIISAPEDQNINDDINTMSLEERGKVAVTMLTTGLYLSERNSSNITMNSALNSFLQNEISNIAGSALRTMDLTVGMETSTNINGTMSTDYSFKFAKRFWNNRVSVSIGGKIATGAKNPGRNQTFFDNVEMQYRLSDTSNQYLRLFYKHDVYDYIEGYLDHYGAGYMWKKKMQRLSEIFSPAKLLTPQRQSSLSKDSIKNERPEKPSESIKN